MMVEVPRGLAFRQRRIGAHGTAIIAQVDGLYLNFVRECKNTLDIRRHCFHILRWCVRDPLPGARPIRAARQAIGPLREACEPTGPDSPCNVESPNRAKQW